MSTEVKVDDLIAEALSGRNRELQLNVAKGVAPLPPEKLVELQVRFAASKDDELASTAKRALGSLEPQRVAQVLQEKARVDVLVYFAETSNHPLILEHVIRHREVPKELIKYLAAKVNPEIQEILLVRQDVIIADPSILEALESNPDLSTYSRRRIGEYRDHLIFRKVIRTEFPVEKEEEEEKAVTEEELEQAIEEVREEVEPEGEMDDVTRLSETQIRHLPVTHRLKLARNAGRTLRGILVRDKNPLVARTVMLESLLTDTELERVASSRAVVDQVFEIIGRNQRWLGKYAVVLALVKNPRAPVGLTMRLVPRLAVRDLRAIRRDYNVGHTVRKRADQLYKIKRV